MGGTLGILYNQTFVGAWNIYLSDDSGLLFMHYAGHVPAFAEMISFLLTGETV